MMVPRPKLLVERILAGEADGEVHPRFPHCDARILHLAQECEFCKHSVILQEERVRLNVSNTGHTNRAWPCPADKARSKESLNSWHGNRPDNSTTAADYMKDPEKDC